MRQGAGAGPPAGVIMAEARGALVLDRWRPVPVRQGAGAGPTAGDHGRWVRGALVFDRWRPVPVRQGAGAGPPAGVIMAGASGDHGSRALETGAGTAGVPELARQLG